MPANTPHNYPYPVGTDRVMDGDDAIKNLATAVDTQLGAAAAGLVSVPTNTANVAASLAVTFPAGRFTAAPIVTTTINAGNPDWFHSTANNITATGAMIWAIRNSGTAAVSVAWHAISI